MSSPLRAIELNKTFPRVDALHSLTLEVPEGAVFALVGPNGAGKTTAIKTFLNLHKPTSGSAEVLGVDSRTLGPAQLAQIGYVSENQKLPGWMTAGDFLAYCKEFYPTWSSDDLDALVRLYELPLDRQLKHLSRGMRVKAQLASSLAYRPKLIVLDEPFSGLDVLVREQLIESVLERTPEASVFLASHDLAEIESFASHIAYLNEGRLAFAEETAALTARFREIQVTLDSPAGLPAHLPATWLNPEVSGVVVGFTDSQFGAGAQAEIRSRFPAAREIAARVMPLRSIVLALEKSARPGKGAR
ncbi:MAG TPA: ABC transporter ATP-binding protein [Bryobacteraceae bacterium]|nr:ABC transporter ATP-binding protein [Bryobacteraceae bacterium]